VLKLLHGAVAGLIDKLIDLAAALGALGLVVIMAVVVVDVIGRYFGAPLYGAQDIEQMTAVFVVFGGMAYCDRQGRHVAVNLLEPVFSRRINKFLTILGNALGMVVFGLIAWYVWEASKLALMLNMATNILQLPRAPFQYALIAFSGLTAAAMALRLVTQIYGGDAGDNDNKAPAQ